MGRNYGRRRGRLEPLGGISGIVAASIGNHNLKFAHADEQEYYRVINRRLDRSEERVRNINR